MPEFQGLKITQDSRAVRCPWDLKRVHLVQGEDRILAAPRGHLGWGGNSGFHAVNLAVQFGAPSLILVGFDLNLDRGVHWHGSHPRGMNNPTARNLARWRRILDGAAETLAGLGIRVLNASPSSALEAYPKMGLAEALEEAGSRPERTRRKAPPPAPKPPLLVHGMHGMGDNLHQRALVQQLMERHEVWLETSWASLYHDLAADGLKVVHKTTSLRTQAKNAARERDRFAASRPPPGAREVRVWYSGAEVRAAGSVLGAMCRNAGCDPERADFRLPVPDAWASRAAALIGQWKPDRPLLVLRPLVERTEWGGCAARNPDAGAYAALLGSVRERFFTVSVADLAPGKEWIAGPRLPADVELHTGELEFEALAALVARADLTFCSPGFMVPLSQAVGTPVACVFGGYEAAYSFSAGERFAPTLGIEPIHRCDCFRHDHHCDKRIDLPAATDRLRHFAADAARRHAG